MDNTEVWVNAANIFASIATFGALIAVAIEIRNSRNVERRKALFDLDEKWREASEQMQKLPIDEYSRNAEGFLEKFQPGSDEYTAFVKVINFFELFGATVFHGGIDKEMALYHYGRTLENWWHELSPVVHKLGITAGPNDVSYLEWIVLQSIKMKPSAGKKLDSQVMALRKEVKPKIVE